MQKKQQNNLKHYQLVIIEECLAKKKIFMKKGVGKKGHQRNDNELFNDFQVTSWEEDPNAPQIHAKREQV